MLDLPKVLGENRLGVISSQIARGCDEQEVMQVLEELDSIWTRIRFHRLSAKARFSLALEAGTSKMDRERLRASAVEMEFQADLLLGKGKALMQRKLSNLIISPPSPPSYATNYVSPTWNWVLHLARGLLGPRVAFTTLYEKLFDSSTMLGMEEQTNHPFAKCAGRIYFDPTKQVHGSLLRGVLNKLPQLPKLVPASELEPGCCYSVVWERGALVSCRVSYESDYHARASNQPKLKKRNQTSVLPHSFLVEWFADVVVWEDSGDRNPQSLWDHEQSSLDVLANATEDVLERHSFLSQSFGPCQLDRMVLDRVGQDLLIALPMVQFPSLHRWLRAMAATSNNALCGVCSCKL
ncbi:hypothetical protein BASA81_005933 [Batrachochytrium salamandrivorans]|nr:hypothetical protein BASA81_005933 [Batrachochytrium salamandrivorans]